LEELKEGISYEDPMEVFDHNIFVIERDFGIQITPDFPIVKLFWYFDQYKKEIMKNGRKK